MSIFSPDDCRKAVRFSTRRQPVMLAVALLLLGFSLPVRAEDTPTPVPQLDMGNPQPAKALPYDAGVKAYRDGDYNQAGKIFAGLHRQAPENTKCTYYLAITEAQLGRFQQAKRLYGEIVTLDPNGEAATLAKEGLKYLPPEATLDLPPHFNQQAASTGAANPATPQAQTPASTATGQAAGQNVTSAISPQDLMAWQMLMSQGNNNGMGSNNPMGSFMPGMMMGMPSGANGASGVDPSMMSTMLMNQMMQNMNLSGEQNENR